MLVGRGAGGAGETIRCRILKNFDFHTLLRLPTAKQLAENQALTSQFELVLLLCLEADMDVNSLIGPAVVAAVVSGVIAIVGMLVSRTTNIQINKDKIAADIDLAERRFAFDKAMAEKRFAYERQQAIFKRRFELAEHLLSEAYRFRDLMKFVRNGVAFGDEGQTREAANGEREGLKRIRDSYFVPIERMQKESAFLSEMMSRRDTARAHFGEDATKAFTLFNSAIQSVRTASIMLIRADEDSSPSNRDFYEKLRHDIWAPLAQLCEKDEIGQSIEEGVKIIERLCRPVLTEVDAN